ncbi:MAG: efflux RND transporter periplasmic adaptor subunit, partial [Gammaproteobacteria bacterium]
MLAKRFKLLITLLVVAVAIAALVAWLSRDKPVAVVVKKVDRGTVQETVANTRAGTIEACRRSGISPSTGGQISSMPVKEGDLVEKGQVLMELWNVDILAQYELARSQAKASAALANQACVRAEVAQREAVRQKKLQKKNLSSEEAVDKADGEARAQQAACDAARASSEVSREQLNVIMAELDRTRLTAPFGGVVAEVNGEIGEFVTPSPVGIPTPPAVDLMDISCLYVSAPIDEVDAPRIRINMNAKISLDAFSDQIFSGRVRRIAPYVLEVEKQARTVDVEVDFICQQDCEHMLPGYS